jgi:hypothetical protein
LWQYRPNQDRKSGQEEAVRKIAHEICE